LSADPLPEPRPSSALLPSSPTGSAVATTAAKIVAMTVATGEGADPAITALWVGGQDRDGLFARLLPDR
jgi:hypothetical protein